MDSTQDKQTDAAGRAGELRQMKNDIINSVANDYFDSMKNESKLLNMTFKKASEYVRKLAKEDVDELLDTATRTAVTEALDKVAAALPEKRQLHPVNEEGHISVYLQYENGKIMASNEVIESVRAVIAAGGKQ